MLYWVAGVIGWGFVLAWVADSAASRGRSQIAWTLLAVVLAIASDVILWVLALGALGKTDNIAVPMLATLAPILALYAAPLGLGVWLRRLPVKIRTARQWPVSCRINGAGKLEILPASVRLVWDDRTQDIPRAALTGAKPDGECVRLTWSDGELVLIPMLPPQTRDGRIEQSQQLARLLAVELPAAVAVRGA
jgi:hypothetical protein